MADVSVLQNRQNIGIRELQGQTGMPKKSNEEFNLVPVDERKRVTDLHFRRTDTDVR